MSKEVDLFEWAVGEIEREYRHLGHQHDWRFLATARRTLSPLSKTALITLNPGGDCHTLGHGRESSEHGSAYVHEAWLRHEPGKAPLQRQVRQMFGMLGEDPDEALSAYFIPFRSPSFAALTRPKESLAFASALWTRLLAQIQPSLIVCIDRVTYGRVREILGSPKAELSHWPLGWGAQSATVLRYDRQLVVRLPHLSRFTVFGREPSKEPLTHLFAQVAEMRRELLAQ